MVPRMLVACLWYFALLQSVVVTLRVISFRMCLLGALGENYKRGAGVLDMQYETKDVLLSCGYDTYIRLWDLRCSYTKR